MKTLSVVLLLLASLALVLVGCSDQSNPMSVTDDPNASVNSSNAAPPALAKSVGHSAAGSAQYFALEGPDNFSLPVRQHINFSAKESKDGSVSGTVKLMEPSGVMKARGAVVGLKVDGNTAKLEYLFTTGPYAGRYAFFVVIDNGEGSKASAPDMVTIAAIYEDEPYPTLEDWRAMSPDEFIAFLESVQEFIPVNVVQEIDGGNVQVR